MNKTVAAFIFFVFFLGRNSFAVNNDSLAYEAQRNKINAMLTERSNKFGLYSESLSSKTGIFGFKTKKDMQKSIDILLEIIRTDNAILKETKILLDYKNDENEKIISDSKDNTDKNLSYMHTINKLQQENDKLKTHIENKRKAKGSISTFIVLLIITVLFTALFFFRNFYSKKS